MSASVTKLTPSALAALMCARVCHDMVSPIGAMSAAIEVLNDLMGNADFQLWNLELTKAIRFSKIGVFQLGELNKEA